MRTDLSIGDRIWVYEGKMSPTESIIENLDEYCIYYRDERELKWTIHPWIYKRPEEKDKLVEKIYWDAEYLKDAAQWIIEHYK